MAALLASNGFTATADILDHPIDYTRVFADKGEADASRIVGTLGSPWDIASPGLVVKKYPCCNSTHRTIDATLSLVSEHSPSLSEIESVVISMPPGEDIPLILQPSLHRAGGQVLHAILHCIRHPRWPSRPQYL